MESYSSSSKKIETIETEVVTNNGSSSPTKISSSKSTTTALKASTNGHSNIDTPDRAQSKQNIFEIYQERPISEKRNSVMENNNLNLIKNNNGNGTVSNNESRSQESLISAGPRSHHDSLTSCSEDLPSFSSSIDDLELRDLRRAKREMDMRLVDREDQVKQNFFFFSY